MPWFNNNKLILAHHHLITWTLLPDIIVVQGYLRACEGLRLLAFAEAGGFKYPNNGEES